MAYTSENREIVDTINRLAETRTQRAKAVAQHETGVTANYVADKMKDAGKQMVGKTYTIEQGQKEFLRKSGLLARNESEWKTRIAGPKGALERAIFKEGSKGTYWEYHWRGAYLEKVYLGHFENSLKKAPKEGYVLLRPENPLGVGSHEKDLSDWYDPVLGKSYDEVDWVKNADAFIPELKTSIEVKTTARAHTSSQNKGLDKEDFSNYDGTVGYAELLVKDTKQYANMGMQKSRQKNIALSLAEGMAEMTGDNSRRSIQKNAKEWERVIEGIGDKLIYETQVNAMFTSFYSISEASAHIKKVLERLNLEAGRPIFSSETGKRVRARPTDMDKLAASYLESAVDDEDFNGVLGIQILRDAPIRNDCVLFATQPDTESVEDVIIKVLRKYLPNEEAVQDFLEVAENTGKAYVNPTVTMTGEYERAYALDPRKAKLGSSTLT